MMRVGVLGHGFAQWAGGVDFLRTVVFSLLQAQTSLELHVLLPTKGPRLTTYKALRMAYRGARKLLDRGYRKRYDLDYRHLSELVRTFPEHVSVHEIDIGRAAILKSARGLDLDVLVPALRPFPRNFPVPWVGYIYDFQHRYFPEYFTKKETDRRNAEFHKMLSRAPSVIVNAKNVAEDVQRFHSESRCKVFPLPFSAAPQNRWLDQSVGHVSHRGTDKPYFIICNQFWKHKDHQTAFLALSKVVKEFPEVNLICTGPTNDIRDPAYFLQLKDFIADLEISNAVHILGMLPKEEQIFLLRNSIALVQPTLFEGGPGGGAVFDAVSLGVKCVVSDIAVNRELSEPVVTFFEAGKHESLAKAMINTIENQSGREVNDDVLIQKGAERRRRCCAVLLDALDTAVGK